MYYACVGRFVFIYPKGEGEHFMNLFDQIVLIATGLVAIYLI